MRVGGARVLDLSAIDRTGLVGRLLRAPLRLLPPTARVRVLQGPLRGARWIVGSGTHGCWLGTYEIEKQRAFARLAGPGSVVFDVGAHVGFYTLLASRLVGPGGAVVAFEPLPRNLRILRQHLEENGCDNASVFAAALAEAPGSVRFRAGADSYGGSVSEGGEVKVEALALDDLLARRRLPPPDLIKIDVEGAELGVLRGARATLREHGPALLLATHGAEVHGSCAAFLRELGYTVRALSGGPSDETDELVATR